MPATKRNPRLIRVLRIDAATRAVSEVRVPPTLDGVRAALGVRMIEVARCARLLGGDLAYVDEEALLAPPADPTFWSMPGMGQPILGPGLIVGDDGRGGDADARTPVDLVVGMIAFARPLLVSADGVLWADAATGDLMVHAPASGFRPLRPRVARRTR